MGEAKKSMAPANTSKIIVGYRTRPVADVAGFMPEFKPPANYKDVEKVAQSVKEQQAAWAAEAKNCPYLGTFDAVTLQDVDNRRVATWVYKDREPGGKKLPISLAVRSWLMKRYADAWPDDTHPGQHKPRAVFVGFEPRGFLKMLGLECSLPGFDLPLPASMWYGNTDHRDITEACIPKEYARAVNWQTVFKRRGIEPKPDWGGPGNDTEEDVRLIVELAVQLGFVKTADEDEG